MQVALAAALVVTAGALAEARAGRRREVRVLSVDRPPAAVARAISDVVEAAR